VLDEIDFTPLGFDYSSRRRSQLLEADLAHLGFSPDRFRLLLCPAAPQLPSLEAGLGCVYVIEGSALGARAILPQIEAALGLDIERGASFFAGFGEDGKPLWRACLKAINDIAPGSPRADRVVEAATATFHMFRHWLPASTARTTPDPVALT
jgi:heme oxygenase